MSSPNAAELARAFPRLGPEKAAELADKLKNWAASDADDAIDDALEAANEALGGFGVEGIQGEGAHVDKYWRDTVLVYVNMGDTYDATVCYDTENEKFFVGSWGDFMEEWEKGAEETAEGDAEAEEKLGDEEGEEDEEEGEVA